MDTQRIRSATAKALEVAVLIVGGSLLIMLLATLVAPTKGPRYCRRAFRTQFPELAVATHEYRFAWTRTMGDHWVTAIVVRPENLSLPPFTVVCHFQSTNYVFNRLEQYDGDKIREFKHSSLNNWNPSAWFK